MNLSRWRQLWFRRKTTRTRENSLLQQSSDLFIAATRLNRHRIQLSNPADYQVLLHHIEVHRYFLCLQRRSDVPLSAAADSWFERVYSPTCATIRSTGLAAEFPTSTETELYLWVAHHRERLQACSNTSRSDQDVALYLVSRFSGRPARSLWKAVCRSLADAWQAAREQPGPPVQPTLLAPAPS